jgi:hypothetical protein
MFVATNTVVSTRTTMVRHVAQLLVDQSTAVQKKAGFTVCNTFTGVKAAENSIALFAM